MKVDWYKLMDIPLNEVDKAQNDSFDKYINKWIEESRKKISA